MVPARRQVVVVGGGPAGMSAALAAAGAGAEVCLIDERETLGGPVDRDTGRTGSGRASLAAAVARSGIETRLGTIAWGLWGGLVTLAPSRASPAVRPAGSPEASPGVARDGAAAVAIEAERVIVACGARDRPIVFPGWTLPAVVTAGEARARIAGPDGARCRVLVAGGGPGLLPLAADLDRVGAEVVLVAEAPRRRPDRLARRAGSGAGAGGESDGGGLSAVLARQRALTVLRRRRVPVLPSRLLARVEGDAGEARAAVVRVDGAWRRRPGPERVVDVDLVCVAYGSVPSAELTLLGGARHVDDEARGGPVPVHDEWMRATAPRLSVAGACAGAAGERQAIEEGRLAGLGAAMDVGRLAPSRAARLAAPVRRRLRARWRERGLLDAVYAPGPGIYELATPDTIACPCEGVSASQVMACLREGLDDVNAVKAATRAGMGACQGRACGRQIAALVARQRGVSIDELPAFTPRPPVRPLPLGLIAEERPDRPRAVVVE